jgi:hypothetical protein
MTTRCERRLVAVPFAPALVGGSNGAGTRTSLDTTLEISFHLSASRLRFLRVGGGLGSAGRGGHLGGGGVVSPSPASMARSSLAIMKPRSGVCGRGGGDSAGGVAVASYASPSGKYGDCASGCTTLCQICRFPLFNFKRNLGWDLIKPISNFCFQFLQKTMTS